jgi:hypothetical protein
MSCEVLLVAANACVVSDAVECSPCYAANSFMESFPKDVASQFYTAFAFVTPGDPFFLYEANKRVSSYYEKAQVRLLIEHVF